MKIDKRYKEYVVPILNDEYKVYVYIGDKVKTNKAICKYLGENMDFIQTENRGKSVYHKGFHPCIWVEGKLDYKTATATLAHEAIHAITHIMDYLGMDMRDWTGNEFLAHSVGAILRKCLPDYKVKQ